MTENRFGINEWWFCDLFTGAAPLQGHLVRVQGRVGHRAWTLNAPAPPLTLKARSTLNRILKADHVAQAVGDAGSFSNRVGLSSSMDSPLF